MYKLCGQTLCVRSVGAEAFKCSTTVQCAAKSACVACLLACLQAGRLNNWRQTGKRESAGASSSAIDGDTLLASVANERERGPR